MSAIFISHSSRDNAVSGELRERLAAAGHRSVFLDFDPADGIPAGHSWEQELYAQLRACQAVIVVVSESSMASDWVFAEITHARALGKPVFPLKVAPCTVRPILTDAQITDLTIDREEGFARLLRGLLVAGLDPRNAFDWDGSRPPYPGLLAFQEEDAAIFFGRAAEIRDALALLRRLYHFGGARWVLVLGASGSGKSSLVRAGIVPRLRRDPERWRVLPPLRPLGDPFGELAGTLAAAFGTLGGERSATQIAAALGGGAGEPRPAKLVELARELRTAASQPEASVLLVVDQLEELLGDDDVGAGRFLRFLRAAVEHPESPLKVLATLRSDFLGAFQAHPELCELAFEPLTVGPLAAEGYAQVIEGPAALAGIELGTGLVQGMVTDTQTEDALPLLAFTLRELWEGWGADGRLVLEEYRDRLGGLQGSVALAAEAVLRARPLEPSEEAELRSAFVAMVQVNDDGQLARRPARQTELPAGVHGVLERFVAARLLVARGDLGERRLEVAHEALLRAWDRLVGWLEQNRAFLLWRRRAEQARLEWLRTQKSKEALLRGTALAEADGWLRDRPATLKPELRTFIEASIAVRRRRRGLLAGTVAAVILALACFGGWAHFQRLLAINQRILFLDLNSLSHARAVRATSPRESARKLTVLEHPELYTHNVDVLALEEGKRLLGHSADLMLVAEHGERGEAVVRWVFDGRWQVALAQAAPIYAAEIASSDLLTSGKVADRRRCVLTAAEDGVVRLWALPEVEGLMLSVLEGKLPKPSEVQKTKPAAEPLVDFSGHAGPVSILRFSADARRAATVSGGELALWQTDKGTVPLILGSWPRTIRSIDFSTDGRRLISTFDDGNVRLHDLDNLFTAPVELAGHETGLADAAFAPDGETAASVSTDGDIWVWNLAEKKGKRLARLAACEPIEITFTHSGERVNAGCADGTARLLEVVGGGEVQRLE